MRPTPTPVLICATIIFCFTISGVVVLSLAHADFTEFRTIVNTILNVAGAVSGLGSLLYAGSAAHSAAATKELLQPPQDPGGIPG